MVSLSRLMLAAPASGHGKTTVAVGIMAALARRGLSVAPAKVGPDYIDPGYHALATGRPSRNLDPWLVEPERVAPLLLRGASHPTPADVCLVEGVMGLLDGRLGEDGFASSAHVASLTATPVALVVDISSTSRTVAATVHGLATIDPALQIAGVVLNKAGTTRHGDEARRAVESVGVPVWGVIPRDARMHVPSRHLGLVPAAERPEAAATLTHLADRAEEHIDLDALVAAAHAAPPLQGTAWSPAAALGLPDPDPAGPSSDGPVVAVAGGRAFTFRYPETTELLEAAGCQVVEIDPVRDVALPAGTAGLYLGGGFPEVHARTLTANRSLVGQIRDAIAGGLPTVAECAGMLYLARTLEDHPMTGAVPADAAMGPRLTLGYRRARAATESVLGPAGRVVTGHEFHRTVTTPGAGAPAAWLLAHGAEDGVPEGFALDPAGTGRASVVASYLHTHWAGDPSSAAAFARAAAQHRERAATASSATVLAPAPLLRAAGRDAAAGLPGVDDLPTDPLRHHGDVEVADGLVDLAVNVRGERPPGWLVEALADELGAVAAYPDPYPATKALAARHGLRREQVLPTAGGAEAFTIVARALTPRDAVVVHPQFTEPEAALRAAGHPVRHVLLRPETGFALTPAAVAEIGDADLVVVGNPTNPTGVLHPAAVLRALARPGRVLLVDEAFMDAVPGEPESLLVDPGPGVLVARSLTKTWSMAGLRAGFVAGDPALVAALAAQQPHWSVGSLALRSMIETATPRARAEAERTATEGRAWTAHLVSGLRSLGIEAVDGSAPFVLARVGTGVREALRDAGWAVRRCDTFPGLDGSWVRIAARDPHTIDGLLRELALVLPRRSA